MRYPPHAPRAGAFPRRSVDLTPIHRRLIPIAGTQFTKTSEIETPSLRSDTNRASKVHYLPPSFRFPRFARGTARGAPTRFPLRAGGTLRRGSSTPVFCELWLGDWYDKGTSLEFTVCEARTLFRPHPQPLSHSVGEGCRGARRCALQRVPPLPPCGRGGRGGEGNTARLPVHARAGKIAPASATLCRTDVPLPGGV